MGENGTVTTSLPRDFIRLRSNSGSVDIHYSVMYQGIPDEYRQEALKTLHETEEHKWNGLKKLRTFMSKEELLCTEEDLTLILRSCKYDLRKSEKKLKKFLKLRQHVLERLAGLDNRKIEIILDHVLFGVLPYRDKHGRVIIFTRPNMHFDLYDPEDVSTSIMVFQLWICSSPLTSITGISYIAEAKTDDLYVLYTSMKNYLSNLKNYLEFPMRVAKVDVMNENWVARLFYNMMRPLLPEKIRKRLTLNGSDYESLRRSYHPDLLPEDFGGNMSPINNACYKECLLRFFQKLKDESTNLKKTMK